jgi:hypothetical protein
MPGARQASRSVLAAGLVLLLAAEGTSSTALAVLARVGSGIGHGLVLAGNLTEITVAALAAKRGGVLGAVYFVNYADLGVPVIGVGVLSPWTGLEAATTAAAIVTAVGCALLIPMVIRQRA